MPFCMNCGNHVPDGMAFCTNCGAKVGEVTPSSSFVQPGGAAPQAPVTPLGQQAQPVNQQQPIQPDAASSAQKRKGALPFVLALLGVFVVGAVAAGFLTNWFGLVAGLDAQDSSGSMADASASAFASAASSSEPSADAASGGASSSADTASSNGEAPDGNASASASSLAGGGASSAIAAIEERLEQAASSQSASSGEGQDSPASGQSSSKPPAEPEADPEPPTPAGATPPVFTNFAASSVSAEDDIDDYRPSSAVDGNVRTAWNTFGEEVGDGSGQWIELGAGELQHVSGLRIMPGFCKSEEMWAKNRRPRNITVTVSDGSSFSYSLEDRFGEFQTVDFPEAVDTTLVRITIDSTYTPTYNGRCYDDCAISEIEVF